MSKYRLKKEYRKGSTVVKSGDQGILINSDFFHKYKNAEILIQERKEVGHFFEDMDGKPVNDAAKPVAKEEVKPVNDAAKKATKSKAKD